MTRRRSTVALTTCLTLAAAGTALAPSASAATVNGAAVAPRVVVADVDGGINPYHEVYQRGTASPVTADVLAEFGIGAGQIIDLTRTGVPAADYAADAAEFAAIEVGKPYWFRGTNVIGITFDDVAASKRKILPDDDGDTHGVGTSAAVLGANPDAVILFVEGVNADSENYAFTHPAVDVVTTSYGFPGSPPLPGHLNKSYQGVVKLGKTHAGASDNSPAISAPDGTSGPWWTLGVAGFHEESSQGRELSSGNVVDFVSDFTQLLPYCALCQTGGVKDVSGTSFATPRTAGTISKIILDARRSVGHVGGIVTAGVTTPRVVQGGNVSLSTWQLRRALEEAADYPTEAEFRAAGFTDDLTTAPVVGFAPYIQTGWGLVSTDPARGVVAEALAQLGITGTPRAAKGTAPCQYNLTAYDARFAYWNANLGSESRGTTNDPYLRCPVLASSASAESGSGGGIVTAPAPVVPEVPYSALLPLLALAIGGAAYAAKARATS